MKNRWVCVKMKINNNQSGIVQQKHQITALYLSLFLSPNILMKMTFTKKVIRDLETNYHPSFVSQKVFNLYV